MHDLADVIRQAVEWEESAYRFYMKAAEKAERESIKNLFEALAKEELKHKSMLAELDLNAVDEVQLNLNWFNLVDGLRKYNFEKITSIMKILEFAMRKELTAHDRYKKIADGIDDAKVKGLCEKLGGMELGHYSMLKAEYNRLFSFP
jgi:rubrerythrin